MLPDPVKQKIGNELRRLGAEKPFETKEARHKQLQAIMSQMTPQESEALFFDWKYWGRDKQFVKDYNEGWPEVCIVYCSGRGFGKGRLASEWIRSKATKKQESIILIGPTSAKVRDVMVLGDSGILNVHPPKDKPEYQPSYARIVWPKTNSIANFYSAEEPDRVRGANGTLCWFDELGEVFNDDMFDQAMLALRKGESRMLITTTPRLGNPTLLKLWDRAVFNDDPPQEGKDVRIIIGSTYENLDNLSKTFQSQVISAYEGTTLGRQELMGEMLFQQQGALWSLALLAQQTLTDGKQLPKMLKVCIGVDPAVTAKKKSDKTGIVIAGLGEDGYGYVIKDRTGTYAPSRWPEIVAAEYDQWMRECPVEVVAEKNQGGDLIREAVLRERPFANVSDVFHTNSKISRAEPVAALYERCKIWHTRGLTELERELVTYAGLPKQKSPDRMDAMVIALTKLLLGQKNYVQVSELLM